MIELLTAGLDWRTARLPAANADLERARLGLDPATGARLALVRFPAGWRREARGFYDVGEEFVVVAGRIWVSSISYRAGHYGWIPPGGFRHDASSPAGAVALTWFAGRPKWTDADGGRPLGPSLRAPLDTLVLPAAGMPLRGGGPGHQHGRTALLPETPSTVEPGGDVLWVGGWRWHRAAAGEPLPDRTGRVLVRTG